MSSRVHKGWYLFFGVSALLLIVAAGVLQRTPGYMDADYYYAGAVQLGDGKGFSQPFIWNYLDNPQSLPAPLFTYWMPLVSLLSAPGWAIFKSFTAARSLLWIVAALIPPLTIWIGMRLHGNSRLALLGGCFALFPAYYFAYLPTTDAFGLMMVLGSLFLITSGEQDQPSPWLVLGSGILSGLLHLSRADGILWFGAGGLWLMVTAWRRREQQARWLVMLALQLVLFTLGYLAVMAPWYVRNLQIFGWFFPPTGSRSLWLTRYEDLFVYPGSILNRDHFLTGGIGLWGKAVWEALLANLQTLLAVQGSVILTPFILWGMISMRSRWLVRGLAWIYALIFFVFTLVFPYAGVNGSFFHAGAAFQPFFYAFAPVGVLAAVSTAARWFRWARADQVLRFSEILLVLVCVVLTGGLFLGKMAGKNGDGWNANATTYAHIDQMLYELGAVPCDVVMVNNPPGYYLQTGRSAVVIPFGDENMLLSAAKKFGVRYLVLDDNNRWHLPALSDGPTNLPGFSFLIRIDSKTIYELNP